MTGPATAAAAAAAIRGAGGVACTARITPDGRYRYELRRTWEPRPGCDRCGQPLEPWGRGWVHATDGEPNRCLPACLPLGATWPRTVCFVMLNPSTADATTDDATIRRCVGFARAWGFGALVVRNLFAWRATDPRGLRAPGIDPVGADNDAYLRTGAESGRDAVTVCAWGAHGDLGGRDQAVLALLRDRGVIPHHLGFTLGGQPLHPLRLPGSVRPAPWET